MTPNRKLSDEASLRRLRRHCPDLVDDLATLVRSRETEVSVEALVRDRVDAELVALVCGAYAALLRARTITH